MAGLRPNAVVALLAAAATLPDAASAGVLINNCCGGIEQYLLNPDTINTTGPTVVAFGTGEGVCCVIEAGQNQSTPFKVFSASKWITGYTILTLIEEGLLKLNTRPSDLFDWWTSDPADKRSTVTVSQLLTQSADMGMFVKGPHKCESDTLLTCAQEAYSVAFKPDAYKYYTGTERVDGEEIFYYTETNWYVLGAMAVNVTGLPTYNDVFHAKLGNRLGISASCAFANLAKGSPGGGLTCSTEDYIKFLMAVFKKTIVSADMVDFAEMPATMLKGIMHDTWNPDLVWAEYLYYGHGSWVECAARGCTGAPRKVSSLGMKGFYPYIWRNGTESHWGIIGREVFEAGATMDDPLWGQPNTKALYRNMFPQVKDTIAAMGSGAPQPPAAPMVGKMYTSVAGAGVVVNDEGATVGSYKEDCTADPLDTCFKVTPDLDFCEEQCADSAACNSFTFCTGNKAAPFPRCYLKTKHLDFNAKPHGGGDCTTFSPSGGRLGSRFGTVARNEGMNLASFRADCGDNKFDLCFAENFTFYDCQAACKQQDGCGSFAYCTGIGNPGTELQRCYLKTASFETTPHAGGDCTSFYPSKSASCKDVKSYYKQQSCCGVPAKELDMNTAKPGGRQQF